MLKFSDSMFIMHRRPCKWALTYVNAAYSWLLRTARTHRHGRHTTEAIRKLQHRQRIPMEQWLERVAKSATIFAVSRRSTCAALAHEAHNHIGQGPGPGPSWQVHETRGGDTFAAISRSASNWINQQRLRYINSMPKVRTRHSVQSRQTYSISAPRI